MPTLTEEPARTIQVTASAPLELMWVMHFVESSHSCEGTHATLEPLRERYGPELGRLRADGLGQYSTEMVVLAHTTGTLRDLDMDRFFDRAGAALAKPVALPSLLSESQAERQVVRERLERLRKDQGLRARYVDLLAALWRGVEPQWRGEGREATLAEVQRWQTLLDEGASYKDVLGLTRLWPGRPDLDDLADGAAEAGTLMLNPCWFGGKMHVVELDGTVFVGRSVRRIEPPYRKVAAEVATSIKALADPTRLTILLRLAHHPASVTEVARQLKLSQPTVSSHVQVLREAGLLDERVVGRSAELSASEDGLRRLFSTAEESMTRLFR